MGCCWARRRKRDCAKPARRASSFCTRGGSWYWSPTRHQQRACSQTHVGRLCPESRKDLARLELLPGCFDQAQPRSAGLVMVQEGKAESGGWGMLMHR